MSKINFLKAVLILFLVGCEPARQSAPETTGTTPVEVGTEPVEVGTEPVEVGTEPVEVGTEPVEVGTELVEVGTEPVEVGTELVEVGTELVEVGTELVEVGTEPGLMVHGVVVDGAGAPVVNALVSVGDSSDVWTRTDSDGRFEIDGRSGGRLLVAAPGFETTSVPVAVSPAITLAKDPLLEKHIYHISFDHLRPGDYYSEDELKSAFPVGYGLGFYQDGDEKTNRAFVDTSVSRDSGGRSLRVTFPAGALKTANSGVDVRIPLLGNYKENSAVYDELYLSYWVRFSEHFDFQRCGGKLPSLGGSLAHSRDGLWKGRIMWRAGGSIQFYMELPHDADGITDDSFRFWGEKLVDGGNICTNRFTPYLSGPGWHQVELHYKLETPGQTDGLFEGWVDGNAGHKVVSSEVFGYYRRPGEGLETLTINAILLSAFLGGSSVDYEQDETVYAWFDEFVVSTRRIGPVP